MEEVDVDALDSLFGRYTPEVVRTISVLSGDDAALAREHLAALRARLGGAGGGHYWEGGAALREKTPRRRAARRPPLVEATPRRPVTPRLEGPRAYAGACVDSRLAQLRGESEPTPDEAPKTSRPSTSTLRRQSRETGQA